MELKPLDTITLTPDGGGSFTGRNAVEVFRLATLASGLRLEMKCPGMKMSRISALKAAKSITGLKANSRAVQLERVLLMLEQAKTQVVYTEDLDGE